MISKILINMPEPHPACLLLSQTLPGVSHANQKDGALLGSLMVPILQNRKLSLREVNLSSVT